VLQCLQRVSVLQCVAACCSAIGCHRVACAVRCSELQCVALRCSVLQYAAVPVNVTESPACDKNGTSTKINTCYDL